MSLWDYLSLAGIMALFMLLPGPGVLALVAHALGAGFRATLPMTLGFIVGDIAYLLAALFGLAALAQAMGDAFLFVRLAGAGYLIYLAWKLWTIPVAVDMEGAAIPKKHAGWSSFLSGLAVTLGNPKVIVFYLGILPAVVDLGKVTLPDIFGMAALVAGLLTVILAGYAVLADRARRFLQSAAAKRRLNRGAGAMLAGAAIAMAMR